MFRRADGYGEHPASWADLAAWCQMTGREPLSGWEWRAFRRIDGAYFAAKQPPKKAEG